MSDPFEINYSDCLQLLSEWDFGTLFTPDLNVSYLPYIMPDHGFIEVHLSNNNPQLGELNGQSCMFSILGPHAYISTDYYTVKPAVPTWNYVSLAVTGRCEVLPPSETSKTMIKTMERFQPQLLTDKETLPDAVFEKMLCAITGVRIRIEAIKGKAKLGQHRSVADQEKVLHSLRENGEKQFVDFIKTWTGVR